MEKFKRYFKIFGKMCIYFAVFLWLLKIPSVGILHGAIGAIIQSFFIAIIAAIFIIPFDSASTRNLPPESLNVR